MGVPSPSPRRVPLHVRAEQHLRALIRQRAYQEGALIPDEITLAQRLGVSRGTLRTALTRLVLEGLLERRAGIGTRVVRPLATSPLVSSDRRSPQTAHSRRALHAPTPARTILACDAGGTRIKLGLVRDGRVLAHAELPARASCGLEQALDRVVRAARSCCRSINLRLADLAGFGLAFPGIIEPRSERILSTPAGKFDDARTLGLPDSLTSRLGLPVRLCNDANAALLGEWTAGAARGVRSAVMMTLGTGIGTSAIIDGVPLRGEHGQAGCLGGHWTMEVPGNRCPCGNVGCAETLASTWALPALARGTPGFDQSTLRTRDPLDFAAVFHAAARGDAVARHLRNHAIAVWSRALVSLVHAYDPQCVILGGGILRSRALLLPRFRDHLTRHAWTPWGTPLLRVARLGDDAALIGMASLFAVTP